MSIALPADWAMLPKEWKHRRISGKTNAYGDIDIFIPQTQGALEDVDGSIKRVKNRRPFNNGKNC
jgi:hypothetical protein